MNTGSRPLPERLGHRIREQEFRPALSYIQGNCRMPLPRQGAFSTQYRLYVELYSLPSAHYEYDAADRRTVGGILFAAWKCCFNVGREVPGRKKKAGKCGIAPQNIE